MWTLTLQRNVKYGNNYDKILNIGTPVTQKVTVTILQNQTAQFQNTEVHQKVMKGMANSVDPDQTRAPDKREY